MKEEAHNPSIDPQLEARIVALVLGEASDFEREELGRLIDERPELAAFKNEIQSVHGLLGDVAADDSIGLDDDWKLSTEKRNAVLTAISGQAKVQPARQLALPSADQRGAKRTGWIAAAAKIAAVLLVVAFIGSMSIPSLQNAREVASSGWLDADSESILDENGAPPATIFLADSAMTVESEEEHLPPAEATAKFESGYENRSRSSLSAIQDSLRTDAARRSPDSYFFDEVRELEPQSADDLAFPEVVENSIAAAPKDSLGWHASPLMPGLPGERSAGTTEGANQSVAGIGLSTPAIDEVPPESSPDQATSFYYLDPGQGQASSRGEPLPSKDAKIRFPDDLDRASPALEGELDIAGDLQQRESQRRESQQFGKQRDSKERGETFRRGGMAAADQPDGEPAPAESFDRELGGGVGGGGGGGLSKGIPAKPTVEGRVDLNSQRDDSVDAGMQLDMPADPISDPASRPTYPTDDRYGDKSNEAFKQDTEKGNVSTPRIIIVEEEPILDHESSGRSLSGPVAGTAIQRGGGQSQAGQAKEDQFWSFKGQGNARQSGRAGLEQSADDSFRASVPNFWERLELNQKSEQGQSQTDQLSSSAQAGGDRYAVPPVAKFFGADVESKTRAPAKRPVAPAGLNEKTAAEEAFSTFSLHVSDVSFKLARAALASGTWPDPSQVRIEEFVNSLDYGDPMPSQREKVACRMEQSVHPFLQQRNLLRVSMRTAAAGRSGSTPLRLTILVDNSGSMERIDRQQTVRRAFALLAQQLKPIDQVTLISFARQPRLLAEKVSGDQPDPLLQLIENLPSEGGTNIEAALQLAFEKAREHRDDRAQNRVILLTDGAVNLGDADPKSLSRMITTMRASGIAFDAAGISAEGLNDEVLEALTRQGDGRYYLLDSLEDADDGFARQIAGALRPSAKNVKVQIEFNPKRVGRYKLLGFEKHRLKQEDFRNDQVDAAEMAAAEAGVALYQFEAKPGGQGDVGSVSVRFQDVSTGQMIENRWPIPFQPDTPRLDQAAPSLRIAACAALLAAKLRGQPLGETVDLRTLSHLIAGLPDRDRNAARVEELGQMIEQARQLSGK